MNFVTIPIYFLQNIKHRVAFNLIVNKSLPLYENAISNSITSSWSKQGSTLNNSGRGRAKSKLKYEECELKTLFYWYIQKIA